MATKTNTAAKTAENENKADNADNMVEVYIPFDHTSGESDTFYCAVNGVAMLIPKGQHVKVPAPYAHVVLNAQAEAERVRSQQRGQRQD